MADDPTDDLNLTESERRKFGAILILRLGEPSEWPPYLRACLGDLLISISIKRISENCGSDTFPPQESEGDNSAD